MQSRPLRPEIRSTAPFASHSAPGRVAAALERVILNGTAGPKDSPLPSISAMVKQYGVSDPTIRLALRYLEEKGLVRMAKRRGALITYEPPINRDIEAMDASVNATNPEPPTEEEYFSETSVPTSPMADVAPAETIAEPESPAEQPRPTDAAALLAQAVDLIKAASGQITTAHADLITDLQRQLDAANARAAALEQRLAAIHALIAGAPTPQAPGE